MKTIAGMFDNVDDAQRAVAELNNLGIRREDISVATQKSGQKGAATGTHETHAAEGAGTGAGIGAAVGAGAGILASLGLLAIPGIGPLLAAGPIVAALTGAGIGAATGGIVGGLIGMGIPEEDAEEYAEGVRRGGTLVTARVDDSKAQAAADVIHRHHAVDMQTRTQEWRSAGWKAQRSTSSATAATSRPAQRASESLTGERTATARNEQTIPVVNETLDVGKREVQRGGVRVYSHVTQQPVAEDVKLRQEKVSVERRAADRPATEEDLKAFKEGSIEMHEKSEEAVVQKKARVTGEVVVRKEAEEKTQAVRDTVRRTDVKVERIEEDGKRGDAGSGPACKP